MKPESLEQEILYDTQSPKSAKRMALSNLLLSESIETNIISRIVGVSERQIRNYRRTYEERGSAAITEDMRYRPVSELEAHECAIRESLLSSPVATSAEASERIEELTGIKRCPTQVRVFIKNIGLKP